MDEGKLSPPSQMRLKAPPYLSWPQKLKKLRRDLIQFDVGKSPLGCFGISMEKVFFVLDQGKVGLDFRIKVPSIPPPFTPYLNGRNGPAESDPWGSFLCVIRE
jgi:hypothetical protein